MELTPDLALEIADAISKWDDPGASVLLDYLEELSGVQARSLQAERDAKPVLGYDCTGRPIREGQWLSHPVSGRVLEGWGEKFKGRSSTHIWKSQAHSVSSGGRMLRFTDGRSMTDPERATCIPAP